MFRCASQEALPSRAVPRPRGRDTFVRCTQRSFIGWRGALVRSAGGQWENLCFKEHLCLPVIQPSNMMAVGIGLEVFSAFSRISLTKQGSLRTITASTVTVTTANRGSLHSPELAAEASSPCVPFSVCTGHSLIRRWGRLPYPWGPASALANRTWWTWHWYSQDSPHLAWQPPLSASWRTAAVERVRVLCDHQVERNRSHVCVRGPWRRRCHVRVGFGERSRGTGGRCRHLYGETVLEWQPSRAFRWLQPQLSSGCARTRVPKAHSPGCSWSSRLQDCVREDMVTVNH